MSEAQASSTTFTEFNVRRDHGTPHFIRLFDSVVDRLEQSAVIRKGEAFGVLLGTVDCGKSCTIAVEGFEPAEVVEDHILSWKPPAGSRQMVVGYYRSHSSSRFAIEEADRYLFERCFPKGARVALLVKEPRTGPGNATIYLGDDGQVEADCVTVEFPFSVRRLGAEPPLAPPPKTPAPRGMRSRAGALWKMGLTAAVVAASVIGLKGVGLFDHPGAIPDAPIIGPASTPAPPPEPSPLKSQPVVPAPKKSIVTKSLAPRVIQPTVAEKPVAPHGDLSTPPRATRQFAPVLRDALRQSIAGEIVVRLRVGVDSSGKVIAAEPLAKGRPLVDALASAAADAVKHWEFEPARRGDLAVPGEVILSFAFRR